jgi:hypothetical protein
MNETRLSHRLADLLASSVATAIERCGLRAFHEDRGGAALLIAALLTPAMMGMTALAVDVGMWRLEKVKLQSAVDSAALAAVHARLGGAEGAVLESVVGRELARNGFDPATPGNGFSVAIKQRDEPAPHDDVEVRATTATDLYFGRLLTSKAPTIEATAVGGLDAGSHGRICVLGLDETAPSTVQFRGTPYVELNCSIASNSSDPLESMEIGGTSTIKATGLVAHGGISGLDGADVEAAVWTNAPRAADPFGPEGRNVQVPPTGTCDIKQSLQIKDDTTLTPGRYCGGIRVNGATVTFTPGLYIIDGGDLVTTGQASLIGDGVTVVLTASSPSKIGGVDVSGGTHLDLRAPGKDDNWAALMGYEGMLIFQDPRAPATTSTNGDNKLLGGSVARLDGAIYFRQQSLIYTGGAELEDGCLMLVARQVLFRGNARLVQMDPTCDSLGVEALRMPSFRLLG